MKAIVITEKTLPGANGPLTPFFARVRREFEDEQQEKPLLYGGE